PRSAMAALAGGPALRDTTEQAGLSDSLRVAPHAVAASPAETMLTASPATPGLMQVLSAGGSNPSSPSTAKFPIRPRLKTNHSQLSLKARTFSASSPDDASESSIGTPISTTFSTFASRTGRSTKESQHQQQQSHASADNNTNAMPPTPSIPTFINGGSYLFETDVHSPFSPGTPNPSTFNAPAALEPCPDAFLLRPFWLLRSVYQTIAHPRGGYLTTRLFVPRDVWRTKGVKLKNVDEKISQLDLLSAALMKLSAVDTLDADAVLEEMQSLELVLDQVQANLTKKLGSDVGVNSVGALFKDAPSGVGDVAGGSGGPHSASVPSDVRDPLTGSVLPPKSSSMPARNYLTSWRKLRSKSSSAGLNSLASSLGAAAREAKEAGGPVMHSVPMTSLPNVRFTKRDIGSVGAMGSGPNANYMGALARLCDSVQIVGMSSVSSPPFYQIARQAEDPGLKLSSPTHVGIELCTRHASEFFGFYVCRFVVQDLSTLLDKFVKRGSEWVML
ncbi:hypothetical protein LTS18_005943, partial [Coniosporium uncinatum]